MATEPAEPAAVATEPAEPAAVAAEPAEPPVWFCTEPPRRGRLPHKLADVPVALRNFLEPQFLRSADGKLRHITPQTGRKTLGGAPSDGWQVQFSDKARKVYRVCSTVNEAELGALVVAAARLDHRIDIHSIVAGGFKGTPFGTTQDRANAWLDHMVAHGEEAAKKWIAEVTPAA